MYLQTNDRDRVSLFYDDVLRGATNFQWTTDVPFTLDSETVSPDEVKKDHRIFFLLGIYGTGLDIKVEDLRNPQPGNMISVVSGIDGPIEWNKPGLRLGRMFEVGGTGFLFAHGYYLPVDHQKIVTRLNNP